MRSYIGKISLIYLILENKFSVFTIREWVEWMGFILCFCFCLLVNTKDKTKT